MATSTSNNTIALVDLSTFGATKVTSGLNAGSIGDYSMAPGSKWVYFAAAPETAASKFDLYVFDETTGSPASVKQIAKSPIVVGPASVYVRYLTATPDGNSVAYETTGGNNHSISVARAAGGTPTIVVSKTAMDSSPMWASNGAALLLGVGVGDTLPKRDLVRVAIGGGSPVTLHAAQAHVSVLYVTP